MGFNSRWIIVLLSVVIVYLLIHIQWYCQQCADCYNSKVSKNNAIEMDSRSNVETIKSGENIKHEEIQDKLASSRDTFKLEPLKLGIDGSVLDCIMWEERRKYDLANKKLHEYRFSSTELEESEHRKRTFQAIFNKRDWPGDNDTSYYGLKASGPGATMRNAQGIIAVLHSLITRLKAALNKTKISILDVACGDLQWMSRFLDTRTDIEYTGADIVPELIAHHRREFRRLKNARFIMRDFVAEPPDRSYDLIICRDVLQHLWRNDADRSLANLAASGSRFLLVTTFRATQRNSDVERGALGGRFSPYNLELPPFSLVPPICASFDWSVEQLGLWPLPLQQISDG